MLHFNIHHLALQKKLSRIIQTCNTSSKADGNTSSTAPISLENLFNILPEGLVWKNRMGARVIAENMLLWRRVDASIAMEKNMKERRRDTTTSATTIAENKFKKEF